MLPNRASVLVVLTSAAIVCADPLVTPSGSATVPLETLLPLFTSQQERANAAPQPPAAAVLVQSQFKARLSSEALHVDAHFAVSVLADNDWVKVPLLTVGPDFYLTAGSAQEERIVAVVDGQLCMMSRVRGDHRFDVSFTVRASVQGAARRLSLHAPPGAAHAPLRLTVDPAFALVEPRAEGESVEVFPRAGQWTLAWQSATPSAAAKKPAQERPALEPRIARATASWVSTLEGKLTLRVRYALQLDREQALTVTLPPGQTLRRVAINGRPLAVAADGPLLRLAVTPAAVGDSEGTVELVLAEELGVLHLSGAVALSLPSVSWPVAELTACAHLPSVFTYRREGGSLEESAAPASGDALEVAPLPGKQLHFRQFLVSGSAPTLQLRYSVDIEKSYFR
jgi:hypothetical protein